MSSAIDRLPVAEPSPSFGDPIPVPVTDRPIKLHQALCWFPDHRSTGLVLTEALAETALRNNAQLQPEPVTAVRIKIRTDGAGVRFAKRRRADGEWELCRTGLDPWMCDVVEQPESEDTSHWHVTLVPGATVTWSGTWDDRPAVESLWIGTPWLRLDLVP